jgi:hypothetical protein
MIDVPGCIEGPLSIPKRVRGWKDAAASDALAWPDAAGCQYVIGCTERDQSSGRVQWEGDRNARLGGAGGRG